MKIGETIYLDHQATTPVDKRVLTEMMPFFEKSFGNPHSVDHWLGWQSSSSVEQAVARIADLIGADTDEIIFTSGATESNNLALLGLARRATKGNRRRILVSSIEHKSILALGRVLECQLGFTVQQIPVDHEGKVEIAELEQALGRDVLAISVMAVNNEIGTIQDIERISTLARCHGAVVHCDAAQAPVAMEMSRFADWVDMLSLSSHKIYGPKGIGIAFIRRELHDQIEPLIYGGGQQNSLRSGTVPVPLCVGMGKAAEILSSENANEEKRSLRLRSERFFKTLTSLPWPMELNGPLIGQNRHPGNVNVGFVDFSAEEILGALQPRLAASTGSACTSGVPEPSHVLKALGLRTQEAESSIRFSLGFGTRDEDIDQAVALIKDVLGRLATTNCS